MKFSCEKALLLSAISTTSRAVAPKSSIPALEGILLEAGDTLRLTGYNLETGIRTSLEANVMQAGSLVLSSRIFLDIVRKLPDDIVTLTSDNYHVNIRCGMSEFNILGTDSAEYPALPEVEENANSFLLERGALGSMIRQTLFAVSTNESRPIHTGSLFEVEDNQLNVVSVDGYRLALRRETVETTTAEPFSFVVPGSALSEVEKICSDSTEPAAVIQGKRHILFQMGDTMLISRRLEGDFLAYRNAIPKNNTIHISGETRALLASIDRVSLIISDKLKSPLRCTFGNGVLDIRTKTAIGDATDKCPIDGDGNGLEIGFNNKYLMDALKAAPADHIRLEMTTGVAPCILLPPEGEPERFLYMVLPVRLKAGE